MDSGERKKRTLAERRESDKLRQRRFRAKKREEARRTQAITSPIEKEKKERVYTLPKKTADEIRATNRIRQQRFRAKRRVELENTMIPIVEKQPEVRIPAKEELPDIIENPVDFMQRVIDEATNSERSRQTEIRREKDRIRKRRERQRKKDRELTLAGFTADEIMKHHFQTKRQHLDKDMDKMQNNAMGTSCSLFDEDDDDDEEMEDEEIAGILSMNTEEATSGNEEYFNAEQFMAQLKEMGLIIDVAMPSDGSPVLELKQETSEDSQQEPTVEIKEEITEETIQESSEESTSSSPTTPHIPDLYPFLEKKPWQRCNSAEERRERERMRKRMYRAKQRYISTGKLEMQWDPTLIKRSPSDDTEAGITPLPAWNKCTSYEQKLEAHRIYNKRYRERLRKDSVLKGETSRRASREASTSSEVANDGGVSPDIFNAMLSNMNEHFDFSSILMHNEVVGK